MLRTDTATDGTVGKGSPGLGHKKMKTLGIPQFAEKIIRISHGR